MARKKYYVGSVGPFLYDDESPIDDQDGDFAGEDRVAFRTDGSIRTNESDSSSDGLMRREDIEALTLHSITLADNPSFEAGDTGWELKSGLSIIEDPTNARRDSWIATGTALGTAACRNNHDFPVESGERYIIYGYAKSTSDADGYVRIRLRYKDSSGAEIGWAEGPNILPGTAYGISRDVVTIPVLTDIVSANIEIVVFYNTVGSWYFDDIFAAMIAKNSDIDALQTTNGPAEAGANNYSLEIHGNAYHSVDYYSYGDNATLGDLDITGCIYPISYGTLGDSAEHWAETWTDDLYIDDWRIKDEGPLVFRENGTIAAALYSYGLYLTGELTENYTFSIPLEDYDKWRILSELADAFRNHDPALAPIELRERIDEEDDFGPTGIYRYGRKPTDYSQVLIECLDELQAQVRI